MTRCGRICLGSRKINLSVALAEQLVGIREVDDQVWQVSFLEYDLGYFDQRSGPGRARSQSVRPGHSVNDVSGMRCKPCDRNAPIGGGGQGRNRTTDTRIFSPLLYQLSYLAIAGLSGSACPLRSGCVGRPQRGRVLDPSARATVNPGSASHAPGALAGSDRSRHSDARTASGRDPVWNPNGSVA